MRRSLSRMVPTLPRSAPFRRLWLGQSVSLVGSQVTLLALPLAAVLFVHATPQQMGYLVAAEMLPVVLVSVFIGVWVDRLRRRPLLIAADLARAVCVGSVPLTALFGVLRMEYLYVISFCLGALSVTFDTASSAFLPTIVEDDELALAYGASVVTESAAEVVGPSIAGVLVQVLTAPIALVVDAISYVLSVIALVSIRVDEGAPSRGDVPTSVGADLRDGLRAVTGDPMLRAIAGCIGTAGIFLEVRLVLLMLFASRELGLDSLAIGCIMAAGSVGGMLGAMAAPRLIARIGVRQTFVVTVLLVPVALAITPLASGSAVVAGGVLLLGQTLFQVVLMASNVCYRMLRQQLSPPDMLGRVNATVRLLTWGGLPLGALLGGFLGEQIGLRPALAISAAGALLGCAWLIPLAVARRATPTALVRGARISVFRTSAG
jgi:MFS family permease